MLNKKGQSLILFVMVLPILLLVLVLVIDIGKVVVLKHELKNINEIVLDYGLNMIEDDDIEFKLVNLINLNKPDIDKVNVNVDDNKIYVYMSDKVEGLISGLVNISIFDVNTSYVGYLEDEKKRIERLGD